jgi:hypothetical protein
MGPHYSERYGAPAEPPMFTADEREQMERARDAARQNEHPKAFDLPNRSREANLAYVQELYEKLSYDDGPLPGTRFK